MQHRNHQPSKTLSGIRLRRLQNRAYPYRRQGESLIIMEENKSLTIKDWAEEDRPREKMLSQGVAALTNAELLAILIATGTKTESAVDLAKILLQKFSNDLYELGRLGPSELSRQVKGIGKAKAVTIAAALVRRIPNSSLT